MGIWGYMDFLAKAAVTYDQYLIAIIGPGGSGKSWMENEVIRPAVRYFFGGAAEKTLGKAMTMHMACKFKQSDVLAKREVNQKFTVPKNEVPIAGTGWASIAEERGDDPKQEDMRRGWEGCA